jgi:UDP-GlcNAc:undecaprenyl-phosphate GlcNAc-1-phosphate transferase
MLAGMVYIAQSAAPLGFPLTREIGVILFGGVLIHAIGILDDRRGLPARVKLGAQVLAVCIVMSQGVLLDGLHLPGGSRLELGLLAYPVTAFFVLGFVNSFNLVDGLDGLASGICAIAALTLGIAGVLEGNFVLAAFSVALLGAVIGFLPFNFIFGKTFLGDAGSMLLGYLVAASALMGSRFTHDATPILLAVAASLVPIVDTFTTILRRLRNRQGLFRADSMHLHHRLIRYGLTPQRAVALILSVTAIAAGQALCLLVEGARPLLVPTFLAGLLVVVGLRRSRPASANEPDASFHEILFYLLGAQNGSGPRLDGKQGIGEVLATPAKSLPHAWIEGGAVSRETADDPAGVAPTS